jgi:hypothetical protein
MTSRTSCSLTRIWLIVSPGRSQRTTAERGRTVSSRSASKAAELVVAVSPALTAFARRAHRYHVLSRKAAMSIKAALRSAPKHNYKAGGRGSQDAACLARPKANVAIERFLTAANARRDPNAAASTGWDVLGQLGEPDLRIAIRGSAPVAARRERAPGGNLWPVGHRGALELADGEKTKQKDL